KTGGGNDRRVSRLRSCINRAPPHAVGGAISSRARPLASGPIWVTATAAIATITAITTNSRVHWVRPVARRIVAADDQEEQVAHELLRPRRQIVRRFAM